jgi:hypothetical protein
VRYFRYLFAITDPLYGAVQWAFLLPEADQKRRAMFVLATSGTVAVAILATVHLGPGRPKASVDDGLTLQELELAKTIVEFEHLPLTRAKQRVIAMRLTPEQKRRMEYERRQREKEIESIQTSVCRMQPYLDRCQ